MTHGCDFKLVVGCVCALCDHVTEADEADVRSAVGVPASEHK